MATLETDFPGRCSSPADLRGDQSPLAGRHASKQAAVEEAIARVFYGAVRTLAAAAVTAIEEWEAQQIGGDDVAQH